MVACSGANGTGPSASVVLWSAKGEGFGEAAYDSASVYFPGLRHEAIAVDRVSGTVRWRARSSDSARPIFGAQNIVLVKDVVVYGDGDVFGFDRRTGAQRWRFAPALLGADKGVGAGFWRLATDGVRVFAGSITGHAYAINAETGALVWATRVTADTNSSVFDPVAAHGQVYVVVRHFTHPLTGEVVAVDASTGTVRWKVEFASVGDTSAAPDPPVVVSGNLVVAANRNGKITALDHVTGNTVWTAPRLPAVDAINDWRALVAINDLVVAASTTDYLTAYDGATGKIKWQTRTGQGSAITKPLTADDSRVYVRFVNDRLGAFSLVDGSRKWIRSAPRGYFQWQPTPAPEALFIPGTEELYALTKD